MPDERARPCYYLATPPHGGGERNNSLNGEKTSVKSIAVLVLSFAVSGFMFGQATNSQSTAQTTTTQTTTGSSTSATTSHKKAHHKHAHKKHHHKKTTDSATPKQ